eukprot:TRINITY_DN10143_c0_g1_i1.p1 TRINITY_DN10143_c0_g1~~TRINITY_DN10143_c0_g1_i1.p1  ORF type:complete len:691 (-),score=59.35 TRINITY_DN10143_c0_g1_i1:117-2189(-)
MFTSILAAHLCVLIALTPPTIGDCTNPFWNYTRTDGYLEHFFDDITVLNDKLIITDVENSSLVFRGLGQPSASFVIANSQANLIGGSTPPSPRQNWTIPGDGWNLKLPNERPEWKYAFQNRSRAELDSYSYQSGAAVANLSPTQQVNYCRIIFFLTNAGADTTLNFILDFDGGSVTFAAAFPNFDKQCNSSSSCAGGATLGAGPLTSYSRSTPYWGDNLAYYIHAVKFDLNTTLQSQKLLRIHLPTTFNPSPSVFQIQGQRSCARQDTDRCGVCRGTGSTCPIYAKPIHYIAAAADGQQQTVDIVQYSQPAQYNQLAVFPQVATQGVYISRLDATKLNVTTVKCATTGNFSFTIQHSINLSNTATTILSVIVARFPSSAEAINVTLLSGRNGQIALRGSLKGCSQSYSRLLTIPAFPLVKGDNATVNISTILAAQETLFFRAPVVNETTRYTFHYVSGTDGLSVSPAALVTVEVNPLTAPTGAPVGSCPLPQPELPPGTSAQGGFFYCNGSTWIFNATVISIPSTSITISPSLGNGSTLVVSGCIILQNGSSLEVVLTSEAAALFSSGRNISVEILQSQSSCISPTGFSNITIRCEAGVRCPSCLHTEQQINSRSLSLVFYSSSSCTPTDGIQEPPPQLWWIAVVVVGAVLVIVLVALLIASRKSDRVRDCLFPWRNHDKPNARMTTMDQ